MKEQEKNSPKPIRGKKGGDIFGAQNIPLEQQNPDIIKPPVTDGGTLPNFKWPFDFSHFKIHPCRRRGLCRILKHQLKAKLLLFTGSKQC